MATPDIFLSYNRAEARRILAERFGGNTHFMPFLPRLLEVFDQNDEALAILREAHDDPRFKDIVRDVGLVEYWRKSGNWGNFARPLGDDDFEMIA
jgi:hypothetical protein